VRQFEVHVSDAPRAVSACKGVIPGRRPTPWGAPANVHLGRGAITFVVLTHLFKFGEDASPRLERLALDSTPIPLAIVSRSRAYRPAFGRSMAVVCCCIRFGHGSSDS
jgi:hypothetical protein